MIVIAAGFLIIYLVYLKQLSAWGRLMMSDISARHLWEHFFFGTGIGQFTWYYPQWQAQYFATHSVVPDNYFLSAGESYIIFNEYLQLFETIGMFGFLALCTIFVFFVISKSNKHLRLLNAVKLTVFVILSCGFTSYPFHVNFMLLMLGFCLATASVVNENKIFFLKSTTFSRPRFAGHQFISIIATLVSGYAVFLCMQNLRAKLEWDILRNRSATHGSELRSAYTTVQKTLKHDPKFQIEYATFLIENNEDNDEAIQALEKSSKKFLSRASVEVLAFAYRKEGSVNQAIAKYEWLSNFLPNKFEPKFQLLTLYKEINDITNIRRIGNRIITMPVKNNSPRVIDIKRKTSEILNEIK
jgi:hypothetical protein